MAKCLVLGANGFLGSHLVDALVGRGHSVRAFDRFNGRIRFDSSENIELYTGDFLNRHDLREALKDIEFVFHFISTTTPITAEDDPLIDVDTNIKMSIELFDECVRQSIKKVIFASTGGAIYGSELGEEPVSESVIPRPVSPYAIGKLTIEHYLRYYRVKYGLSSVSLRISNPYGERQPLHRKQGVIPIFMERIIKGQPLTILGDGSMIRDYIYVKDMAQRVSDIFEKDMLNEVYNLGTGHGISVNEVVRSIEELTQTHTNKEYLPMPATFVQKIVLDTNLLVEEFGQQPQTELKDGLKATWNYVLAHQNEES